MNPNLIKISTVNMADTDWLKFRNNGIGGSEVATVLNLNPYQSAVELFYKKVYRETESIQNERMFWGTIHEDTIANVWQYYENDIDTMMKNYEENRIVRKCQRLNAILQNPEFPHLFANIDRKILNPEGILEIKTISDFAVNQWESGVPPYHLVQLQTYLAITGLNYGELAILKNGRNFEVLPFNRNESIIEGIIVKSKEFWESVLEAREIINNGGTIEHLEPAPDNSMAYEKFMKERFTSKVKEIEGSQELLNIAYEYQKCTKDISEIETLKQGYKNQIISAIRETDKISFGVNGYITFNGNTKGVRTLNVRVK